MASTIYKNGIDKKECIIPFPLTYTRKEKSMNKLNEMFEKDQTQSIDKTKDVNKLSDQVLKLQGLEKEIKEDEEALKNKKKSAAMLSEEIIPTMMTEMSLSSLKLADGSSVEVKPVYGASIPIAKREEAFKWLRDNGLGDLIKNEVTVSFGRNEDNKAVQYAVLAQGQGYQPVQKLKVEPMTLKALVRERIESGREIPSDLFNVYAGNRTTIKRK